MVGRYQSRGEVGNQDEALVFPLSNPWCLVRLGAVGGHLCSIFPSLDLDYVPSFFWYLYFAPYSSSVVFFQEVSLVPPLAVLGCLEGGQGGDHRNFVF